MDFRHGIREAELFLGWTFVTKDDRIRWGFPGMIRQGQERGSDAQAASRGRHSAGAGQAEANGEGDGARTRNLKRDKLAL